MSPRIPKSLQLETLIVVRELYGGAELSSPVADPSLVSFTTDKDSLTEQRVFLEEYLRHQPPEVLARFSSPRDAELLELDVDVVRNDLPARLRATLPVTFCCVVLPHGHDQWVLVPAIGHMFHLPPTADRIERIKEEIRRMVAAREPTPVELARLFPAERHRLERLSLNIDRSDLSVPGKSRALKRAAVDRKRRAQALEVLKSIGLPLHDNESVLQAPKTVARERELEHLHTLLAGERRNSVLLVGPSLAGKTALLHQWLRDERAARRKRLVVATSGAQLIAGMSGHGQWQERIHRVMKAAETLDALLYFDNIADLFGDHPDSSVDLPGALRPFLEEERVRLLGELRPEALRRYEHRHVGFMSTLLRIDVPPLTPTQTEQALAERVAHMARSAPQRPNLDPQAIKPLMDLVERYQPYQAYPGKAIRLYEAVCAFDGQVRGHAQPAPITTEQMLQVFSLQSGIPLFLLRQDQGLELDEVLRGLGRRLIGQQPAVRRVAETICVVKARLQPAGKPLAVFFFVGPTGVGKTELARSLAAFLFGDEKRLTRFDMSDFMDPGAAQRLIRGTDRAEGLLTRRVRQQPFCVLLLDEIEKAHPAVFDLLLQVCGEGRLTGAGGRTAFFHNAIIIMTSNLGAAHRRDAIGFGDREISNEAYYQEQVERTFRPELVNRLDRVVAFRHLTPAQIKEVAALSIDGLSQRRAFAELGVVLDLSDAAVDDLAQGGFSAEYGVRHLQRHLERCLITPAARLLASLGDQARSTTLRVRLARESGGRTAKPTGDSKHILARSQEGPFAFELLRGRASQRRARTRAAARLGTLRRSVHHALALDPVTEVVERIDFLVAQLNAPKRKRQQEKTPRAHDQADLAAELHRLQKLWKVVQAECEALEAAEALALASVYDQEDDSTYLSEGEDCFRRFRHQLYHLLVAERAHRDTATVLVQEIQRYPFDLWLVPLLRQAAQRGWRIAVHVHGEKAPRDDPWPRERQWGPPHDAEWVIERLGAEKRPFRNLLLRCNGALAGIAMALEAGLHRYEGLSPPGTALMLCELKSHQADLDDEAWLDGRLAPRPPERFAEIRRAPTVRAYGTPSGPCQLLGGEREVAVPLSSYWERYEEIGVEHLLAYADHDERSLDDLFQPTLTASRATQ